METWKCNFILLLACLAAAFGCSKAPEVTVPERNKVTAEGGTDTKSILGIRSSASLGSLSVWIIAGWDTTYASVAGSALAAECKPQYATIRIAGNLPGGTTGWKQSDTVTANIGRMDKDNITCYATRSETLASGVNEFDISARKAVCKIVLSAVENKISEGAYAGKQIQIRKVFIINGIGRYRLFNEADNVFRPAPINGRWWFNPSGLQGSADDLKSIMPADEGLMSEPALSRNEEGFSVAYGAESALDIDLYTGPNDTAQDHWAGDGSGLADGGWEPRMTRLVLECSINGKTCYYPVTLENLQAGYCYIIRKLTITRFGNDFPDQPFVYEEGSMQVSLATWDGVTLREII